jgi:hypothetical protein
MEDMQCETTTMIALDIKSLPLFWEFLLFWTLTSGPHQEMTLKISATDGHVGIIIH